MKILMEVKKMIQNYIFMYYKLPSLVKAQSFISKIKKGRTHISHIDVVSHSSGEMLVIVSLSNINDDNISHYESILEKYAELNEGRQIKNEKELNFELLKCRFESYKKVTPLECFSISKPMCVLVNDFLFSKQNIVFIGNGEIPYDFAESFLIYLEVLYRIRFIHVKKVEEMYMLEAKIQEDNKYNILLHSSFLDEYLQLNPIREKNNLCLYGCTYYNESDIPESFNKIYVDFRR